MVADVEGDASEALLAQADRAAGARDWATARMTLLAAAQAAPARPDIWMRLASTERATGSPAAALQAIDRALALTPLDFLALLLRATLLDQMRSPDAGLAFVRALAQRPNAAPTPAVARMIDRGETVRAAYLAASGRTIEAAMASASSVATPEERKRLDRFRTNHLRETRVYHSEPTHYHYPGLVEREFHDRGPFPWLAAFEAATGDIAADLQRVIAAERAELVPYVQYAPGEPVQQWETLNHSLDWTAIHLINRGQVVAANAAHCPATMAALAGIPQPIIPGRSPNAMFSLLKPGAHIPPHTGIANTRLVCHLPLAVPEGCWFRVGAETRPWREGEAFVFDDTIEHEACNPTDQLRAVLIVDVWHPDLNEREQAGVIALMTAGEEATGDGL